MKKALLPVDSYKDFIIVVMRHGGSVDQIAKDLRYSEQELVEYIKSSGIDKQLSRRSWQWKAGKKRKRNVIVSKHKKAS